MTWGLSAHARRLITLAIAGLVVAVLTRRPEFAGLAAPAVLLLAARSARRPSWITVRVSSLDDRLVEGVDSAVGVEIADQGRYDVELKIEVGDAIAAGPAVTVPAVAESPDQGGSPDPASPKPGRVLLPFTAERWGQRQVGTLTVTLRDSYRLTEGRAYVGLPVVGVRPMPAPLNSSVVLSRLPSRLGEHASRAAGEGGEFVGVREFVPGDRQRRINWPATTRHGTLHLSMFAAERTQNLVVIADATSYVGDVGTSSLDLVLRGAAGAITRYLAGRDRVGLIVYGSRLSWLAPGQGQRHYQRLLDLLVVQPDGVERAADLIRLPRAALPPGALILLFSPLLDPRLVEALRDLRERGFTVVVIDVLNAEPGHDASRVSRLTGRIWRLEQQAIRFSLTQIGVPVVHWDGAGSLDDPLAPYTRRAMVMRR